MQHVLIRKVNLFKRTVGPDGDVKVTHRSCVILTNICFEADDAFVDFDQRLEVSALPVFGAPDCDLPDEVGENLAVVELDHDGGRKELVGVPERLHGWSEFLDDSEDGLVVLEVVLDHHS